MWEQMPPRHEQVKPTTMEMICQFNKLKPRKCEGQSNPLVYEKCLRKQKNLFEFMEYPERFKVHLATYQFEKEDKFWWGTMKPRAGEPPLSWNQLKELRDAKYYHWDVKKTKEQEFMRQKQGDMSIM